MSRAGDFSPDTIRLLAERAHNHCSNPHCGVQTAMPLSKPRRSLRVGEAAHIHGIGKETPRYRDDLTPKQLAEITNGIWLCRTCHGLIDKSDDIYSSDTLFKWKREHEEYVRLGFHGKANYRHMIVSNLDSDMKEASPLARQIARDLPYAWEYKLTAELLYNFAKELHGRAVELREGLYTKRGKFIEGDKYFEWISAKFDEASEIGVVAAELINRRLLASWGESGVPGDKHEIYNVCILIRNTFLRQIEIEEDILFTYSDKTFARIKEYIRGFSDFNINELFLITQKMKEVFSAERPTGLHRFELEIGVHAKFAELPKVAEECLSDYMSKRRG